jgi:flavin reductase (DIM6/NTAB) family NADH-FMN oxidoreductase RutF|tara:strand:- start:45 stop:407 length:363 start_codon:yes stop_codon:yes gene_type:complete
VDQTSKKTALRKIPDDLYILTAQSEDQNISAAMVKWVTQASFTLPLVAVGAKVDSQVHGIIKSSQTFALNILGKGRLDLAFPFFRSAQRKGQWAVDNLFGLALLACQSVKNPRHLSSVIW